MKHYQPQFKQLRFTQVKKGEEERVYFATEKMNWSAINNEPPTSLYKAYRKISQSLGDSISIAVWFKFGVTNTS